ncbi:MAG: hypothetical protein E1N59_1274 [Puniceicoccaceae bacterium 5H]|nr:MAG: hypothetical protein E1N59_1274 [Puniceicoccaceae bacterium 5H]
MAISTSLSRFAPWAEEARTQALRKLLHDGGNQLLGVLSLAESWRDSTPDEECIEDWEEVYLAAQKLKTQLANMREILTEDSSVEWVEAIAWLETNQELLQNLLPRGMKWECHTNAESARLHIPESRWRDLLVACIMFQVGEVTGQGVLHCQLERHGDVLELFWRYESKRPELFAEIEERMHQLCASLDTEFDIQVVPEAIETVLRWEVDTQGEPPALRDR